MYEISKKYCDLKDSAIKQLRKSIKDRKNPSDYISDSFGINVLANDITTTDGVLIAEIALLDNHVILIDGDGQIYDISLIGSFEFFHLVDEINLQKI